MTSCDDQYFHNTCFECSLEYFMAYLFFSVFNMFGYFLIIYNVFNFDYGSNTNTIKFLISCAWFIFSCFFSRMFCIKKIDTPEGETLLYRSQDFTGL
jgi:prepilin signal peptidase PulO-like enzyme (type II secretory pathway)